MPGHRDTTVSITVGPQVAGIEVKEPVIDGIWPGATEDQVAMGVRDLLRSTLAFTYHLRAGGTLAQAENFVAQESVETN